MYCEEEDDEIVKPKIAEIEKYKLNNIIRRK